MSTGTRPVLGGTGRWAGRARSMAPAAAIVAVQLALFPVPRGVFVQGAIVGGLTALIALGMALTYRSDRVVSFAQGDLGMAPAVLSYLLLDAWGWPWLLAVLGGLAASAVLGGVVEVAIIRRFRNAPRLLLTVATIGLAQLLAGIALLLPRLFDTRVLATIIDPPFDLTFTIDPIRFGPNSVLALVAVPVTALALAGLLRGSDVGLAVRAAADRSDRAALLGVPVARLRTLVWVVAGTLAFIAVFLRASVLGLPVGSALSLTILVRALASLVLGRMTDLPAVAASAVALGVLEQAVAWGDPRVSALEDVPVEPIIAVVVAAALLLRRRRSARLELGDTASWLAADEVRPVPATLARLPLVRATRLGVGVVLLGVALALPHVLAVDKSLRASAVLVYAILGLSVVVLTGWTGQVSLGQVALFAFGAAIGAKALTTWDLDVALALPLSSLAGAAAAVVIGLPALRLRGLELAVITLAVSMATTAWLLNSAFFDWVPDGRVERSPVLGTVDIDSPTRIFVLALVVLLICLAMLQGIRTTRTGRALLAMRDNERAAQAYGLSPLRVRLVGFAISGALAGVAGGVFVLHQQTFGRDPYAPAQNLFVLAMVIVGGVASPMGALLGALWFQGTRWFLPGDWVFLASGVGVLLVLMVLPGGIGGLVLRLRTRWLSWVADRHHVDAPGFSTVAQGFDEPATAANHHAATPREPVAAPGPRP